MYVSYGNDYWINIKFPLHKMQKQTDLYEFKASLPGLHSNTLVIYHLTFIYCAYECVCVHKYTHTCTHLHTRMQAHILWDVCGNHSTAFRN